MKRKGTLVHLTLFLTAFQFQITPHLKYNFFYYTISFFYFWNLKLHPIFNSCTLILQTHLRLYEPHLSYEPIFIFTKEVNPYPSSPNLNPNPNPNHLPQTQLGDLKALFESIFIIKMTCFFSPIYFPNYHWPKLKSIFIFFKLKPISIFISLMYSSPSFSKPNPSPSLYYCVDKCQSTLQWLSIDVHWH